MEEIQDVRSETDGSGIHQTATNYQQSAPMIRIAAQRPLSESQYAALTSAGAVAPGGTLRLSFIHVKYKKCDFTPHF